jgi:hypothetical protein
MPVLRLDNGRMNLGGLKGHDGVAGGAHHAARSSRVRLAVILGSCALALFVVAEVASRLLERVAKTVPAARPAGDARSLVAPEGEAREQYRQYVLAIERALVSPDPGARATAFESLLPELLQADPASVVDLFARQGPGPAREQLRDEIAGRWVRQDPESAMLWLESLEDAGERRAAANQAVRAIAAYSAEDALAAAERLRVGRDDGTVERLVLIWAAEDPEAALRWLQRQPADEPWKSLRARIEAGGASRPSGN